jgi:transcriptional regulator with XRE-family HTH domain
VDLGGVASGQGFMSGQPALDFAGLLRQLRTESQLTQEELAERAGISERTVSNLERRINKTPHKDTAGMLADAMSLTGPVRDLFIRAARGRAAPADVLAARTVSPTASPATAATAGPATPPGAWRLADGPVPRELPADVAAFTGREGELAELDRLLQTAAGQQDVAPGVVVIWAVSGTAGVGETARALLSAHRAKAPFPDRQLHVNLRGHDPDQPVPAADALAGFLRALGAAAPDISLEEAERAARYRSVVAGRRLLVVLDNAVTVEQVRPAFPGSPPVLMVITSRDATGRPGVPGRRPAPGSGPAATRRRRRAAAHPGRRVGRR